MEKSFDFDAILKAHAKKHKGKPTQFVSVAGGVQKRLENNLKHRRSSRLTVFDRIRNLPRLSQSDSPVQISAAKQKIDHRRQQLEKWKEEKAKKKKEAEAKKKKPFIAGVPHNSLRFVPPPPVLKAIPSTSRITRSKTTRNIKNQANEPKQIQTQSFAPLNAPFRAPQIKNITKMPVLAPVKTRKNKKVSTSVFKPILPSASQTEVRQTRSRAYTMHNGPPQSNKAQSTTAKGKTAKPIPKAPIKYQQSSSSSENELAVNTLSSSSDNDCIVILNSSTDSISLPSSPRMESKKTPSLVAVPPAVDNPRRRTPRMSPVPKSESSSEEKLRSPKTPEQIAEEARRISPCVTMSRGKANARREMKNKLQQGLLDEDASDIGIVDDFRRQLTSETKRITEMCNKWDKIYDQVALPETVQELVRGAVGQARLLMSKKLQQFASLVEQCARPELGAALVTPADLLGFWDMVFMQVVNVDMRFKALEELKARDWAQVQPAQEERRAKPATKPAAKPRPAGPSRLKEMIAAARKAKQAELQPPAADDNTFEAGFFCVRSPARSPRTPATPARGHNLLKAVLSSEAKKASSSKRSASFAILRASALGKDAECEGVVPLPQTPLHQVNLHATPGRSILKQKQNASNLNKSIKVVLFDQLDNETQKHNSTTENIQAPAVGECLEVDIEKHSKKGRGHSRRNSTLIRQDAVTSDCTTVVTRGRRKESNEAEEKQKTPQTNEKTPKRNSHKKKVLEESYEAEENQKMPTISEKSKRRVRKQKVLEAIDNNELDENLKTPQAEKTPKRRAPKLKVRQETENNEPEENQKNPQASIKTPKRSARKHNVLLESNEAEEIQKNVLPESSSCRRSTRSRKSAA